MNHQLKRRVADRGVPALNRRATDRQILPSSVLRRLCLILLVAPWILILSLKNLLLIDDSTSSLFIFVLVSELAVVSFACLALVNYRMTGLRRYELGREHERLLFSHSRDGMLLVRVENGGSASVNEYSFVIEAENPAAVERLSSIGQGVSYVGCEIDEALPEWLRPIIRREYSNCVTSRTARQYEVTYPDGRLAHESVATPVFSPNGNSVTHLIIIMRDISQRIQHELELAYALKKAEKANASKSEFLASMSHELRTPLNAILGFSDALTEGIGGPLTTRQAEYLGHIHESGRHLLSIISDILDLSKIEAGQVVLREETIAVSALIESCVVMVKGRAALKNIPIRCAIATSLPSIKADPLRLKQVLINLLSNAVKFTDHGAVIIAASFESERGFEFSVTDTGIGMTVAEQEIAIQPFGQVESAFSRNNSGTGLGLPIAKQLVEMHGGSLALTSSSGQGTRVTIAFPAARAMSAERNGHLLKAEV